MRVYDSVLVEELNYKAILISEETTVEDVIRSIPHFYISVIHGFSEQKITNHATPSKFTEAHIHAERTIPSLGSCSQLALCLCPS